MSDNADHDTYADLDMQHEPDEAGAVPCPNYACERGLVPIGPPDMATGEKPKAQCYRCRGTGQVADRRQSQRRQGAGRRQWNEI